MATATQDETYAGIRRPLLMILDAAGTIGMAEQVILATLLAINPKATKRDVQLELLDLEKNKLAKLTQPTHGQWVAELTDIGRLAVGCTADYAPGVKENTATPGVAQVKLPDDWRPAAFNPHFDTRDYFEKQSEQLDRMLYMVRFNADLASIGGGTDFNNDAVMMSRTDLAGIFLVLRDMIEQIGERNSIMYAHICDKWGQERRQSERELQENNQAVKVS